MDPDGKNWTLVAAGFRNPFDIAFNDVGELFTYDADMEMDVGTPWYRPTRVNHVVSGGESTAGDTARGNGLTIRRTVCLLWLKLVRDHRREFYLAHS